MPICPNCRVAFLDGEQHQCPQPTPTFGLRPAGATFGLIGLIAPLLMQTVFTAVVGAVDPKGGDFGAEALILGSFAASTVTGFLLFTRKWSVAAKVVGGVIYCPIMLAILFYVHVTVWFALFDGDSF